MNYKPVVLVILDGWGHREDITHNAIAEARTPFFDSLWEQYPHSVLDASEESVGLPEGQIGNSEVGHMTIGAGTIIDTDLVRITKAIRTGEFGKNPAFQKLFTHVKENGSTLHVMGLVSPGGVHSHQEHLHAFLRACKVEGVAKVAIHVFTDGRDTAPQASVQYLHNLERVIAEEGVGRIATLAGRFFAMDRDKNWDRLARVEDAMFLCKGTICELQKASDLVKELHANGHIDEHVEPHVFVDEKGEGAGIQKDDGLFFFNFRADRARQLCEKVLERTKNTNTVFVTLTEYDASLPVDVAFGPQRVQTTLSAEIAHAGLRQAHVAETEKYAHATYFLNGGIEQPHEGEEFILIERRKDVLTHDLAPEMRAREITDKALEQIQAGLDFMFINYANADMVGHTANKPAIITAVETVDRELARLVPAILEQGGAVLISADHGNAELNIDMESGEKHTAHTLNLVPAILTIEGTQLRERGTLADIAPTILELLSLPQPQSMKGKSLLVS